MNINYRYILVSLLFLLSTSGVVSQDLFIRNGANISVQQDLLTGEPFVLELNLPINSGNCTDVEVELALDPNILFNSLITTNAFEVISTSSTSIIVKNKVPLANSQNIQFNMAANTNGNVCKDQPLLMSATTSFFDASGSCGQNVTSNDVTIIPKYNQNHVMDISVVNGADVCIGGYTRYKINIPGLRKLGGFNLANVNMNASFRGTISSLTTSQNVPITYSIISDSGCDETIGWSYNDILVGRSNWIYLTVINDCNCYGDSGMQSLDVNVELSGNDPCGVIITLQDQNTFNKDYYCCNGNIPVSYSLSKSVEGSYSNNICSGSCTEYPYIFGFSAKNCSFPIQQFTIEDDISQDIEVTSLRSSRYINALGAEIKYQFCYELDSNPGTEICKTPGQDINYNSIVKFSDQPNSIFNINIPSNSRIIKVKWSFMDDIPAWYQTYITQILYFKINPGVNALQDNIAIFSATSPSILESIIYEHSPLVSCEPDYRIDGRVKNSLIDANFGQTATSAFPLDEVRLRYVLRNYGEVDNPNADITIDLPFGVAYLGNPTYGSYSGPVVPNSSPVDPISGNVTINYNSLSNQLEFNNLNLPSYCDNTITSALIEFDIKVDPGTLSQALQIPASITGGYQTNTTIYINEMYRLDARSYKMCPNGVMDTSYATVGINEPFDLVLEIENVGNVEASDLKILANLPSVGDFSLHDNASRNSQYGINLTSQPLALNSEQFATTTSNSYNNNQICDPIGTLFTISDAFLQIVEAPNQVLSPGEKFQVRMPSIILQAVSGEVSYFDFVFCANRLDINTEISAPSDLLTIEFQDTETCEEVLECEIKEDFLSRADLDFDVMIQGSTATITHQVLNNQDAWFPIWGDNTSGGAGYHWGPGQYASSHTYDQPGTYDICITIENYQAEEDRQSNRCHCKILCKKITINQ